MINEQLQRRGLYALAMVLFLLSSWCVIMPLALPMMPLMDKFFWMDVPMQYQRALVVIHGALGLCGAALMISFRPFAWYVLMAVGSIGIVQGLLAVPAFLPTLINILAVFFLYTCRPLYEPNPAVKAPQAAPPSSDALRRRGP
jgi:hypothetical protein